MPEAADRDALRKAQRAWLVFHEAESGWLTSNAMHGQQGTSGPLTIAGAGLTRLQERVCDLKAAQELRGCRRIEGLGESDAHRACDAFCAAAA